ncbi:site-specific integrase [Weissella diestrammenae]|uniref:Site-specific integrase n=1 Tax=Weissella diestrammenae TaxID=1162633 RepID=A0A7G9T4F3_9LACO|nr:site-specific integrase [Weissella diestrammenae]MCM0583514.1 site-specific integrase [Weissella diestrammenae]QNN74978.1 site-specific integrase [Weissella diestrammenae]
MSENDINKKILFPNYFDEWIAKYEKSDVARQTFITHYSAQKEVSEYFEGIKISDITKNVFQKFLNDFAETHAKSTVRGLSVNVGMVLKDAVSEGILDKDPTFRVKINGHASKDSSQKFLEESDFNNMVHHIENYPLNRWLMIIYTTALSGMRISETFALTMNDIDFRNNTISVTKSKTAHRPFEFVKPKTNSSIRHIEMPNKFFDQLNRYISECSPLDEHIFGETSDTRAVGKHLSSLLTSIGASKIISPHGLRHTHASILLNHDVDIKYVSARLGHSSISVTQNVYTHLLSSKRDLEAGRTLDILGQ